MSAPARHIERARKSLASGRYLLKGEFLEQAGRDAYLASLHAALAFIAQRTGKEPKTHSGARTEFARLARDEPGIDRAYVALLAQGYELKTIADYEGDEPMSPEVIEAALAASERMVNLIADLVA